MATSGPTGKFRSYYNNFLRDHPNFSVKLTQHAQDRMEERDIRLPEIQTVLMTGSLVHVEPDIRTGLDKYRVAGRDADGRGLEVVANLDESGPGRVVIITAIDTQDTGGGRPPVETQRKGR